MEHYNPTFNCTKTLNYQLSTINIHLSKLVKIVKKVTKVTK